MLPSLPLPTHWLKAYRAQLLHQLEIHRVKPSRPNLLEQHRLHHVVLRGNGNLGKKGEQLTTQTDTGGRNAVLLISRFLYVS